MSANKKIAGTATLIRGVSYSLIHPIDRRKGTFAFTRGEPLEIADPDVLDYISTLTEPVLDGDGMEVNKPMFRISKGAAGSAASRGPRATASDEDEAPARPRARKVGRR